MITFIKNLFNKKPEFTCIDCLLFHNCHILCDKVRFGKDLVNFINKYYCCPDCGGLILQSDDGKLHGDMRYQKCYSCGHFFTLNDYEPHQHCGRPIQIEISSQAKELKYKFIDIDRSGH